MYCLKFKRPTETSSVRERTTKNGRKQCHGVCVICGAKKAQFVKGSGVVNIFINNLPFEMHYPGHNFLGPGTKLNKRLNEDLTPKSWSQPVDRDDEAAYRHDICYLKNKDAKSRNECDKAMLKDLENIINPTSSEKRHTSIAKAIIGTKARLRLGLQKKNWHHSLDG